MLPKNSENTQIFLVRVTTITPMLPEPGRVASDLAAVSNTQNIRFASEVPKSWLFQSNPQLYDLRAALGRFTSRFGRSRDMRKKSVSETRSMFGRRGRKEA